MLLIPLLDNCIVTRFTNIKYYPKFQANPTTESVSNTERFNPHMHTYVRYIVSQIKACINKNIDECNV